MILVVDRSNTTLRYRNQTLLMERDNKPARYFPIQQLEQVIIYGNPLVESAVWRALADAGIPATLLAGRGGGNHAVLASGLATTLPLRQLQYHFSQVPELKRAMAVYFVRQKLISYLLPLRTLNALYEVDTAANNVFALLMADTSQRLDKVRDIPSLLGVEGQLAQAWFALLAKSLPFQWKFAGRNRRPPRDPVNALLSLGYTLVGSEVRQAVISHGFDPALGFLHQAYPGRESLALDMTEIFRASVDDFVLRWLVDTELDDSSFYYRDDTGCRLSKAARPLFYKAWGARRYCWPRPLQDSQSEESSHASGADQDDDGQNETTENDWPAAWLPEILNGQVMALRAYMKQLAADTGAEEDIENAFTGTGNASGDTEPSLETIEE